jgi:Domain of unknown function (DUF4186)
VSGMSAGRSPEWPVTSRPVPPSWSTAASYAHDHHWCGADGQGVLLSQTPAPGVVYVQHELAPYVTSGRQRWSITPFESRTARRFGSPLPGVLAVSYDREGSYLPLKCPMPDPMPDSLDQKLDAIARHRFRSKFHLRGRERVTAELSGPSTMRLHARDFISRRLAPAEPDKDGRQTPYRGHPVFVAQHATATCCRTCLQRWHQIPKGQELSRAERAYVVDVICRWIEREVGGLPGAG